MPKTIEIQDDEIAIIWSTEDVKMQCEWLDDEQALDVLNHIDHKHDACIGVNWDVIEYTAHFMYPKPEEKTDASDVA
jgi:hypothetical protein